MRVLSTLYSTATSGTITCTDERKDLIVIQEGALAVTLTLPLPANPVNNQVVTFTSVGGVTTLTMTAAVGTIIGAITTLAAFGKFTFIYNTGSGAGKWYQPA